MRTTTTEKTLAYRRILGTDHPVRLSVQRGTGRTWQLIRVCNGICEHAQTFRTRREALMALEPPITCAGARELN